MEYRKLNSVTISDSYPILFLQWLLADKVTHIRLPENGFQYSLGVIPISTPPIWFENSQFNILGSTQHCFSDYLYKFLIIYMDDIISWANTQEEALKNYELILKCAVDCGVQFKATKCLKDYIPNMY